MSEDRRDFKTKYEHWEIIVSYLEKYPQLIKTKFERFDGDSMEVKKLWTQMAEHLNSLGYGKKSPEKWQLAVGRWKSKVKAKAANLRMEMQKTGGGPAKTSFLTDLEERLMGIVGWKAVTGDNNPELGIKLSTSGREDIPPPTEPQQKNVEAHPSEPPQKRSKLDFTPEPQPSTSKAIPPPLSFFYNDQALAENIHINKSPKVTKKIPQTTQKSRKMVTLHQVHTENMVVLKNIEKSMTSMAASVAEIKTDFKEYIHFLKTRDTE